MDGIETRCRDLVQKVAEWSYPGPHGSFPDITRATSLRATLSCDDLDMLELTIRLEDEFGIELADAAFERWDTFADVVRDVSQACGSALAPSEENT